MSIEFKSPTTNKVDLSPSMLRSVQSKSSADVMVRNFSLMSTSLVIDDCTQR